MHPSASRDPSPPHPIPLVSVVIPARYGSSRLPGKPLAEIGGRTMIEHVYRRAEAARGVARVIVATDDDRILTTVGKFGGEAVMTSPSHESGTDRIAEVARGLESDIIVNVQGDEPLLDSSAIEHAVTPLLADATLVMSTLGAPLDEVSDSDNPNVVKVLVDGRGFALYFSRAPVPYRRQNTPLGASVLRHIGLYAYRRTFLLTLAGLARTPLECSESLEQLRALEHGYRIRVVETRAVPASVDTAEDLERVRRLAANGQLA